MGVNYSILYVEATETTIVQRYKESRRPHPLAAECGTIQEAVQREMALLSPVRERADHIINTTGLSLSKLQSLIREYFAADEERTQMTVNVVSFGFKYGIPIDADLVLDVRFLPNPFYVDALRGLTGMDAPVRDYVLENDAARAFLERLYALIDFLIPQYAEEGRFALNIAVGCTGGQHRSVAVANALAQHLTVGDEDVRLINRDSKTNLTQK